MSLVVNTNILVRHNEVIELIRHNDFLDKKQIAEKMNLSWPTVKKELNELMNEGLIIYDEDSDLKRYCPNSNYGYFLSIAVGATETKVSLVDFAFNPVRFFSQQVDKEFKVVPKNLEQKLQQENCSENQECLCYQTERTYLKIYNMCTTIIETFLDFFDASAKQLLAIGLSLPGIVDKETNIMVFCPNIRELINIDVSKVIRQDVLDRMKNNNISFHICHDTIAATVYEKEHLYNVNSFEHDYKDSPNMSVIYMGSGLGSGLIIQNRLLIGASASAGEIGHFDFDYCDLKPENNTEEENKKYYFYIEEDNKENSDNPKITKVSQIKLEDNMCLCGKQNCLESLIRVKVFNANNLEDFLKKTSEVQLKRFAELNPYRYRVLKHLIGKVLNITINYLNVDLIAFTGRILNGIPQLKQEMESLKIGYSLKASAEKCHILTEKGPADSVAIGAAILSYYSIYCDLSKEETISW